MVKKYVQIKKVRKISIKKKIHQSAQSATITIYSAHASPGLPVRRAPDNLGVANWPSCALAGGNGLISP